MTEQKDPYHFVCECGKILINFGEHLECEILENGKKYPAGHVKRILRGDVCKMNTPEKIQYFREKYLLKQ